MRMEQSAARRLRHAHKVVKRRSRIKENAFRRAITTTDVVDATVLVSIQTDADGQATATVTNVVAPPAQATNAPPRPENVVPTADAQPSPPGPPQITPSPSSPNTLSTAIVPSSQTNTLNPSATTSPPGIVAGDRSTSSSSAKSSTTSTAKPEASTSSSSSNNSPRVAGAVIGSIALVSIILLIMVCFCRWRRSRRRNKNFTHKPGESNANLAGAPTASPGGHSVVTRQRGLVPSTQFFNNPLANPQNQEGITHENQQTAMPQNRSSSPTLGHNKKKMVGAGLAAGAAGGAGLAALEHERRSPYHQEFTPGTPIPEHPTQSPRQNRDDDVISVTSMYREDWPGPHAAGVDPLQFRDSYQSRSVTASPTGRGGVYDATRVPINQYERPVSVWPGPGAPNPTTIPEPGANQGQRLHPVQQEEIMHRSGPMLQPDHHQDEELREETLRPSPARTPQIRSAEMAAYPFPERTASPHSGFNPVDFPPRKPVPGAYNDHGIP